jgi:hypothetical protein
LGGAWHIVTRPFPWALKMLRIDADAILSYSLGGLAFMGFLSCFFISYNTTVFPRELYGEAVNSQAIVQFFLSLTALGGHLWHAYRSRIGANQDFSELFPVPAKSTKAPTNSSAVNLLNSTLDITETSVGN